MKETVINIPSQNEEGTKQIIFEETLEAILFAAGHPIAYATLARVFDLTPTKVKELVIDYSLEYNRSPISRGVELLTYPDSCQLVTKPAHLPEIRNVLGIKKSGTLSTSSMEALAIVAYNQPVTRIFVDTLRRADSSYAMNNLLDRGLIESKGRLDAPGRPMLYGTTSDFLRCFGLKDLSELPETSDDLNAMFEKAQNAKEPDEDAIEGAEQVDIFEGEAAAVAEAAMEHEPSAEDDIHPMDLIDPEQTIAPEETVVSDDPTDPEDATTDTTIPEDNVSSDEPTAPEEDDTTDPTVDETALDNDTDTFEPEITENEE